MYKYTTVSARRLGLIIIIIFNNIYFNIIDILVFGIILTSCVVATFRGFVKELFSIISWILSLIVASNFFEKFKIKLLDHISEEIIVDLIAFGFPFLGTLILSSIISSWLSPKFESVSYTHLTLPTSYAV